MNHALVCPYCDRSDAIGAKDEPRFYRDGRLLATCFHGHEGTGKKVFDAETGAKVQNADLQPFEVLYRLAEPTGARGHGAEFLAQKCGIFIVTREAVARAGTPIPSEKDILRAEADGGAITVAPLFLGPKMVGLEARIVEAGPTLKVTKWTRTIGTDGVYIANPGVQPQVAIIFEGIWDAVAAAWDAFQEDELERYAFLSIKAGTSAQVLQSVLQAHFPGVPALLITDQDGSGKSARPRMAKAGVAFPAILKGVGSAKDYRDADPKIRRAALLEAIEAALEAPDPTRDHGDVKFARRALEGAYRAKSTGMRDLESWRFGQRCAGICKANPAKATTFAVRAKFANRPPVPEGQRDFRVFFTHPEMRRIQTDYPDLAAAILAGATESPMSPEWTPPVFLPETGAHWTTIPAKDRKAYATAHGWEPWDGQDIGAFTAEDLVEVQEAIGNAYHYVIIPGAPAAETGCRVLAVAFATALCGLRAQELGQTGTPTGFNPGTWFYGGPATGKGTAAKITAAAVSGETRTYGSQRFGGEKETGWLTESALHLPVVFKDELDQYLDRSASEDLKAFLGGEALQRRKAYGMDMTLYPRPVVFSTNEIKINPEDEATKERIVLVELQPNPLATKFQRNNAFERFHAWMAEGGALRLHRVAVYLYSAFRKLPVGDVKFTRSAVFDAALLHVCKVLDLDAAAIMSPSEANKEAAILRGAPWFQALADYAQYEMNGADEFSAKAHDLWSVRLEDESSKKKLRRYLESFRASAREHGGALSICGYSVDLPPFHSTAANTLVRFRRLAHADVS
jgi:hypothetical protein